VLSSNGDDLSVSNRNRADDLDLVVRLFKKYGLAVPASLRQAQANANWIVDMQVDIPWCRIVFPHNARIAIPWQESKSMFRHSLTETTASLRSKHGATNAIDKKFLDALVPPVTNKYRDELIALAVSVAKIGLPVRSWPFPAGEAYLQHSVYAAVSDLFMAFAPSPTDFRANQNVDCKYLVKAAKSAPTDKDVTLLSSYKPPAAIVIPQTGLVVAHMELQPGTASEAEWHFDVFKCAVTTSMTLLAMQKTECADYKDVAIPFVIGVHDHVSLYATRFATKEEASEGAIVIDKVISNVPFHDANKAASREKHRFLATLAVLLSKSVESACEINNA
jgi:hypothetical protein